MTTAVTAATTGTSLYTTPSTSTPDQTMDSQMFLKLLVTQLDNQDPSSPMDSTQMITQTSQLASMEQLTDLNTASTNSYDLQMRSAAANVLGKTVDWTDGNGTAQSGTVTAVSFSGSTPTVTVGGATIALSDLTGISEDSGSSGSAAGATSGTSAD